MASPDYQEREQSGIKHYALRLYLEAATRILGSRWNLKYIDCCAGPWNSKTTDYSDTSFGIAIEVLQKAAEDLAKRDRSPRIAALLIEKRTQPFKELEKFAKDSAGSIVRVDARNEDFTERIFEIARYCSTPNTFPFVFIDPWGWKLAGISQIESLLKLDPGEVLINLMSSFIARFVKDEKTDLSDLLGSDFPELRKLSGPELEFAIVRKYCELIKEKGNFQYVCALPVMSSDSDSFIFYLIYATRHPKGVEVFKAVEKRTELQTHVFRASAQQHGRQNRSGNLELYGADVLYRERRYQELARENQSRAKDAIRQLILAQREIDYAICWAEALQFSAVYEADLREWLGKWEHSGGIRVLGRTSAKEVLKRGKHKIVLARPGDTLI